MLAYRLIHRIEFQEQVTGRDPGGGKVVTWQTATLDGQPLLSVPAEVLTGPGRDQIAAGIKHSDVAARINLRWFPGLKPNWRVLWDGQVFAITGTSTDVSGRREWRLVCTAGLTDGQ